MATTLSWLPGLITQDEASIKFLNGTNLAFTGIETLIVDGPVTNVLHEFNTDTYGSAHYIIHAECGSDQRETVNVSVVAKLGKASITVYGRINTGVNLVDLQADITGTTLTLYATSAVVGLQNIKVTAFATLAQIIVESSSRATVYYFAKVNSTPAFTINTGPYSTDQVKPTLTFYKGLTYRIDQLDTSNNADTLLVGTGTDGGLSTSTFNYTVTVAGPQAPDTGNKYLLNGVYRAVPNFVVGYTYVFDQSDNTNVYWPNANGTTANPHPLNFSADNLSGERGGGTSYLNQVEYRLDGAVVTQAVYNSSAFNAATARQVQIIATASTPATLYYWCYNHLAMGNSITSSYLSGMSYYLDNKKVTYADYTNAAMFLAAASRYIEVIVADNYPNTLYYFSSTTAGMGATINVTTLSDTGSTGGTGSGGTGGGSTGGTVTGADTQLSNLGATAINVSLLPNVTSSIDLGSASKRWKDLYLSGNSIILGNALITATGSAVNLPAGSTVAGAAIGSGSGGSGGASVLNDLTDVVITAPVSNGQVLKYNGVNWFNGADETGSGSGASSNSFSTIEVAGQSSVIADSAADTLTLIAGPNISLATNAAGDTITISAASGGSGGASGVSAGVANRLAYYPTTGSVVADTGVGLSWNGEFLQVLGTLYATGAKSYVRANWATLNDLNIEAPANSWRGMVAYAQDTGRLYYAHSGIWNRLAAFSEIPTSSNAFGLVQIDGQDNVVADSSSDTITFIAGAGMTITTNSTNSIITFASSGGGGGGGITTEDAQDAAASLFTGGTHTGITFSYNDNNNTINATVNANAGIYTDEQAQDAAASLFATGTHSGIAFTYNDLANTLSATVSYPTAYTDENAQDAAAPLFVNGSHQGISFAYADASNVINATVSGEYIQDQAAALFTAGTHTNISFNYVDASNRIDATVTLPTAYTNEDAQDAVAAALTAGSHTGISFTYGSTQDAANRIDAVVSYANITLSGTTTLQQCVKVLNAKTGATGVVVHDYLTGDEFYHSGMFANFTANFTNVPTTGERVIEISVSMSQGATPYGITAIQINGAAQTLWWAGNVTPIYSSLNTVDVVKFKLFRTGSSWIAAGEVSGQPNSGGSGGSSYSLPTASTSVLGGVRIDGATITIDGSGIIRAANSGTTTFAALTDNAGLTADQFYLPAITRLAVTSAGSSAYLFDQYTGNNPTIYAISGTTIAFDLSVGLSNHPFLIRTSGGVNYNIGLTHVTSGGVVSTGASAQGKTSGTLYWKIPATTTGNYQYICQAHGNMVGVITIKDIAAI